MKMINAVITHVSSTNGHCYAQADDGKTVFINRRLMPNGGPELEALEVEVGVLERYEAMSLRVIEHGSVPEPQRKPPAAPHPKPEPKPIATPAPRIDASELPPDVAKMVGLIDEPQGRKTKRDRLKEI